MDETLSKIKENLLKCFIFPFKSFLVLVSQWLNIQMQHGFYDSDFIVTCNLYTFTYTHHVTYVHFMYVTLYSVSTQERTEAKPCIINGRMQPQFTVMKYFWKCSVHGVISFAMQTPTLHYMCYLWLSEQVKLFFFFRSFVHIEWEAILLWTRCSVAQCPCVAAQSFCGYTIAAVTHGKVVGVLMYSVWVDVIAAVVGNVSDDTIAHVPEQMPRFIWTAILLNTGRSVTSLF